MKSLAPGFLAEFKKHKSLQAAVEESLSSSKSQPRSGTNPKKNPKSSGNGKIPKKEGNGLSFSTEFGECGGKKEQEEEEDKAQPQSYNRLLREDLLSCGTVLQLSELPEDGFSEQDIKNLVQPFGKVSDLILLRSRNEAYLEMNYREAVIAAVKFGETTPVLLNGKRIRISVAERPRAAPAQVKKPLKKRVVTPKKATPSTKKAPSSSSSSKSPKALPGKKEKVKKTTTGEKKVKKNPGMAVAAPGQNSTDPKEENQEQIQDSKDPKNPKNPEEIPEQEKSGNGTGNGTELAPPAPTPGEEPSEGTTKAQEDSSVLLLSNLPDKGFSEEEISNLAKPFGGLRDVLILPSHKKAFLELGRSGADSMVKFHSCFPLFLEGIPLGLQALPQLRSLHDEEAIFTSLIKDSDPKVDVVCLRQHLVLLGNLPAQGFRELEVVCVGLRFGKVENYMVLRGRNRAILQLDSPKSARSMYSFLQQYPYSMGDHTLTCSLSPHCHLPEAEAGKKEVKREEGSRGSSGWKKIPEGSGTAQKAAGNPSAAKKGSIPGGNVPNEEIPVGQVEIPESQPGGAARESPTGMDVEGVDHGIGIPVVSVRSEEKPAALCGAGKEEAHPEPKLDVKKEDEEPSGAAMESLESSSKAEGDPEVIPAAGEPPGAIPGATFPMDEAPVASPGVTQPNLDPAALEKSPIPEAGKNIHETSTERKALPKTLDAPGKKVDVAGAEREGKVEESVLKAVGENPGKVLVQAGAEQEKPPGKSAAKGGGTAVENSGNSGGDSHGGNSVKIPQNKGMGAVKSEESRPAAPGNPSASLKESCIGKTLLKAVVSVPDILKQRIPVRISEPSLGKAGEQKIPPKAGLERKIPPKGVAQPGSGSIPWKGNGNSGADGQGDGGKSSSQQEKDSQLESRAASKQCPAGESGTSGTKEDPGGNQAPGGSGAAAGKSGASSVGKQKEEEELFPFNLDEFVTVDEVVEEVESPVTLRRNPPRGKRKEPPKANPSEPMAKKRKGKSCGAEGELSFVTLDEIGEEEEAPVPLPGVDPQGLVVVDEVVEEEELSEAVKDPRALLTLDEISEQEEQGSHRDGPRPEFEERDLKAEPLVTVDEIGEVEELPLNEPTELSAEEGKGNRGDCVTSQVPDDPNTLVTVDEIQEDNEDNPLVTLDEVNEDEDDFLADFNHLKEELNFVTVDEVGDEEEENAFPGKNPPEDEDDEDIVAVAGPEEMGILGDTNPEEEMAEISKPKAAQLGSGDAEPKSQQKKTTFPGVPKTQSTPKALDILVPKAGFFCQICSLFYADEPSMINHCRTSLHRQNMEKFMAKQQQDNGGEEPSSR